MNKHDFKYPAVDVSELDGAVSLHPNKVEGRDRELSRLELVQFWESIKNLWIKRFDPLVPSIREPNKFVRFGDTPFDSGVADRYDGKVFRLHGHRYDDDDQNWNFIWRDISVSWYKYSTRSPFMSRYPTMAERDQMYLEIEAEINRITDLDVLEGKTGLSYYEGRLRNPPKHFTELDLMEQQAQQMAKIRNNAVYGAHAQPSILYKGK